MKTVVRFLSRLVLALLVVITLFIGYNAWDVWSSANQNDKTSADAIVVMGAAQFNGTPSPVLKARLDQAAALWKADRAPTIVVTGGKGTGDKSSEAGASAAYLGQKGVPDRSILREVQGRSSWESLQAASVFMKSRGIESVLLVSDPFHNARIKQMSKDLDLDPYLSPTQTSPIHGRQKQIHYIKETTALTLGRIFGFSKLAVLEDELSAK